MHSAQQRERLPSGDTDKKICVQPRTGLNRATAMLHDGSVSRNVFGEGRSSIQTERNARLRWEVLFNPAGVGGKMIGGALVRRT